MLRRLIVSALLILMVSVAPALAVSPEEVAFQQAKAAFAEIQSDMSEGLKLYQADALTAPVILATIDKDLGLLEDVVVYDCFSKWYSLEYSSYVVLANVLSNWFRNGTPAPNAAVVVNTAGYLDLLAQAELPLVNCNAVQ